MKLKNNVNLTNIIKKYRNTIILKSKDSESIERDPILNLI